MIFSDLSLEAFIIIIVGQSPTFTNNLPDTLTIQNTEGVGTNIYQLTTSDGDTEDTGQLTVSLTSATGIASTLFEFDTITRELTWTIVKT